MRDHASAPDPSAILCRRQAQAEETRRVLREMCDAADRAIDDQVSRSSGGALPKKQRLSGAWHERRDTSQYSAVDTLSVTAG
jgi:hypothetical protein